MNNHNIGDFSQPAATFHGLFLPEPEAQLAGYAAIIHAYQLDVPTPDGIALISTKHHRHQQAPFDIFTPRHAPEAELHAQLQFALRYEGVNLSVLSALFKTLDKAELTRELEPQISTPYARKIWFLYEWILDDMLEIPDLANKKIKFTHILNEQLQYAGPDRIVQRQRIKNNLPGTPYFCPLIRRTEKLEEYINQQLNHAVQSDVKNIHTDLLTRASSFLLLQDSKASYAIEGEHPPANRTERWAQAIMQAGQNPLSHAELLRLQEIVIGDFRFTHYGYRNEGGFIGEHDRATQMPLPQHISARSEDLMTLMDGWIETNNLLKESDFHPVLIAAMLAFGFVFIHPFEDGNGRIHRYLIHHALNEHHFTPPGMAFPISSIMLERITDYRASLEWFSKPRLKLIEWRPTEKNNVEVLNDTQDLYRFYDATKQAEFLFECIETTITEVLPNEIAYLRRHDQFIAFLSSYISMPDRLNKLLVLFLNQNNGKLSKRKREKEFELLTDEEVKTIEKKYQEIFEL